ncbi:MAG TPA: hypothetical protein VE974_15645 [Thermoanaerobaculia bacterium]|nr:hypothetical protein [Thermoanaerobaculia bacterium]
MPKKYALPAFLDGRCTPAAYEHWLSAKAIAHMRRDRDRGNPTATRASYMVAIHQAVIASNGSDYYTGEPLDWERISTYDNDQSKLRRRAYKRELARLPTVDHVGDGLGAPDFRICGWLTNDCKADLTLPELMEFCRRILDHATTRGTPSAHHL